MRMLDIIRKKRDGGELSREEIDFFIKGFTKGEIPDYQASALLMAIYFRDMTKKETLYLTLSMADSGDKADLSGISGIKADKHSTGGVGDKTTLVVMPLVASLGVRVAKMSGKGLGHTGGTVDKLESIPGYRTVLPRKEFIDTVNTVGASLIGQSENLAPADKLLYALRDVTATVEKIPLIASSIMSKKIASGADLVLLDVKCGSGGFMKSLDTARALAREMVDIGNAAGIKTAAMITDMDVPLGNKIGNSLEIEEASEVLSGKGPCDLTGLCAALSAKILNMAGKGPLSDCEEMARKAIENGSGRLKLAEIVKAQGGDPDYILGKKSFEKTKFSFEVKAKESGYITSTDTEKIGLCAMLLGAGRSAKDEKIDYSAGIVLHKKYGDFVSRGDVLATLYTERENTLSDAAALFRSAVTYGRQETVKRKIILDTIG